MEEETRQELAEQFETDADTISEAVEMGWIPPTEFKGDMDNFRSPVDFVKRGKEFIPFVKKENQKLREEIDSYKVRFGDIETKLKATEAEIKEKDRVMKKVLDLHDNISEREYNRALETIKRQQTEAINNSDGAEWSRLENEKEKLAKPEKVDFKVNEPEKPNEPPEFVEWKSENKWFDTDKELQEYASAIEPLLINRGFSGKELLNKISEEVKIRYRDKFENRNKGTSDLDSTDNASASASSRKKSYNDLPEDAKNACDRMIKNGVYKDRNDYVKDYFEGE